MVVFFFQSESSFRQQQRGLYGLALGYFAQYSVCDCELWSCVWGMVLFVNATWLHFSPFVLCVSLFSRMSSIHSLRLCCPRSVPLHTPGSTSRPGKENISKNMRKGWQRRRRNLSKMNSLRRNQRWDKYNLFICVDAELFDKVFKSISEHFKMLCPLDRIWNWLTFQGWLASWAMNDALTDQSERSRLPILPHKTMQCYSISYTVWDTIHIFCFLQCLPPTRA